MGEVGGLDVGAQCRGIRDEGGAVEGLDVQQQVPVVVHGQAHRVVPGGGRPLVQCDLLEILIEQAREHEQEARTTDGRGE